MSDSSEEALENYVYRRITSPHFKVKKNWVAPQAFYIQPYMRGLSVFRADMASPFNVLQTRIEQERRILSNSDNMLRIKAEEWLSKNPDVATLLKKDYRVVKIPIVSVKAMGFVNFEDPDTDGHMNILGSYEDFIIHADDFVYLIDTGKARILSPEECLAHSK